LLKEGEFGVEEGVGLQEGVEGGVGGVREQVVEDAGGEGGCGGGVGEKVVTEFSEVGFQLTKF